MLKPYLLSYWFVVLSLVEIGSLLSWRHRQRWRALEGNTHIERCHLAYIIDWFIGVAIITRMMKLYSCDPLCVRLFDL